MNETTTTTETLEEDNIPEINESCVGCLTIPITHLTLETPVPIGGWLSYFAEHSTAVLVDPAGRPAISTLAVRKILRERKRQAELTAESHERLFAELDRMRPRGGGVPAVEGMTPFESMVAAGGIITPEQEFGGRERPNWIRDELEAGARQRAEEKREAEAAAKERVAKQMKNRLS